MAIFGSLWDRTLQTRAADGLRGVTLTTVPHSLPATNPEILVPVLRSVQEFAYPVNVGLLGLRGNASLNTVGFAPAPSAATCPTVEYEVISAVLHTIIK